MPKPKPFESSTSPTNWGADEVDEEDDDEEEEEDDDDDDEAEMFFLESLESSTLNSRVLTEGVEVTVVEGVEEEEEEKMLWLVCEEAVASCCCKFLAKILNCLNNSRTCRKLTISISSAEFPLMNFVTTCCSSACCSGV
jgi:hypothetical protein